MRATEWLTQPISGELEKPPERGRQARQTRRADTAHAELRRLPSGPGARQRDDLIGGAGHSTLFRYDAASDTLEALGVDASGKTLAGEGANPPRPLFGMPRISAAGKRVIVRAPEFAGTHHGLVKTPSDDKDTGLFPWTE